MNDSNELNQETEKEGFNQTDKKEPARKNSLFLDILNNIKSSRDRKAQERASSRLELYCIIVIIVFTAYFKASNYAGQSTPLLYYYENATVTSVEKVDDRWKVSISYRVGSDLQYKNLYYRKNPAYAVGDTIELKIQTVNPANIEIMGS